MGGERGGEREIEWLNGEACCDHSPLLLDDVQWLAASKVSRVHSGGASISKMGARNNKLCPWLSISLKKTKVFFR